MTKWVTPKATFTRRRTMATMFKKSSLWSFLNNFRKSLQLSSIKKIPAITSNKLVLLTILLIITVLAQTTSGFRTTHFNNGEGRKLFGGYRITPKHCRGTKTLPRSDPRANGPTICMFNHECAQRNGEVVGACMDGFLFGACCQIPHDYDLETTLLNDAQNLYYQQQQQKLQSEPKPISNLAAAQSYESYGGESLQQQSQQSEEHKNHEVGGSSTVNNHHTSHGIYEQGNLEKVYQQLESSSSTNYIPHRPITNTYTSSSYQNENHKVKPTEFAYDSNTNDISTDVNTSQNEENPQNENNSDYILNTSQNNIPEQSQSTTMAISSDYNSVEEQQFDIKQNDKLQPASQGFESSGSVEGVKLASNASSDSATNRPNLLLQGPPKIHVDKTKVKISSPSSAPNDDFVMQVLSTLPPDHDHDIMMTFTTEVPMKISSSLTDHVSSESNSFEEEPSATQIPIKLIENSKKPESLEQKPNENQNGNSNQESSSSDLNLHHHNHLILDEAQFTHSDITHPGADADLIEDLQFSTGYGPLPVYVENDKGSSTSKPNPTTLPPRQSDEEDQYVLVQTITNEKKPQTSASTNPTTSTSAAAHDSIESIILQLNNTNAGPAYSIVNQQSASYNTNEEQGTTQDPYLTKEPSTASLIYHLEEETRKPEVSTTQGNKESTYHYMATQTQLPSYLEPVTEQSLNIHSETSTGVVTDHRPDLPAYQTSSNYASYEQTSASQSLDEHTVPASGYHDASDSASHQTSEFNKMPAMGIAYPVDMSYFEEESNSANESEEPSYAQTVATSNRPSSTDSYQKISETTEPQLMPTYTRVPTVNTQKPIATYIGVVTSQNFNQQKEPQNFYNQVPPEVSISSHTTQVHNEDNSYAPSQPVKVTTSSYSQSPITSTSRPVQEHSIITESYTSSQITTDYGNKPIDSSSTLRPVLVTASPKPRPKPKPKPKPSNKRPSKRPATSDNKKTSKPQFTQIQNDRGPQQPTNDYNTHENPQSNYNNYPGPSKPEGPTQLSQANHQSTSHYNVESSRPERPSSQVNQGNHQSTSHYNVESSRPERPSSQGNQGNHQSTSHYNVESSRPERPSSQGNHQSTSHYNGEASRPERPSSQGNHQTNSHYNVESSRPERPSSQGNQGNHQSTSHYNVESSRPERPSSQAAHTTSHYTIESSRPERPSSQVSQGNQPTNSYAPQPSPTYNTESSLDTQNSYNQASAQQNLNQDSQQPGNSYQSAPVKQASEVYNDNTAQYPSNSYTSSASQKPQKQPSASEQNHQNFNHQQPSFNYNTNSGNTKPNSPAGGSNPNNNKQKNPSKPLNPNGYQQEQQYQATGAPPRPLVNYNQAQNVVSSPTKRPSSSKPVDVKNKPISTSYVSGPPTPRPTVNQINYHYDEVPPLVIADDKLDSFVQSTAQNVVGATLQTYPANVFVNSVTPVQVQEPQSVYNKHKKPSFVKVSQTTKAPIPTILITPKPTVINLVTASTWEQNPSYNRFPSTTPQPSKNTDYSTNTIPQIHYSPQQVITNDFDDPGYFGMQTNLHHGLTQTTGAGFPLPSDDRPAFPGYYGPTPVYPAFSVPGEKFGSQIEEETHTSPNDFVNFPPVRNPNLNMSAVASAVTSDLELSTPSFVEDTVLKDKMNTLVHKIVESLQGNFEALSELIDDPNSTASTYQADQQATTRKPTRKPTRVATTSKTKVTTRKPVSRLTTKAPTRKPSVTTRRPVSKRTTTTTRKPITRKPTRKATTTTTAPVEEDEIVDEEDEEDVNPQDNEIDQSETLSTGGGRRIKCGMRPHVKSGRIVGGKGATFGAYPWQVLVRESTWLGLFTKNKCGGVLISSRYVMTAAHCQPGFLASLVAVMGEFDISGDLESKRATTKNVKRVIVHRQYNPATFENDLALLELDSPVTYDTHIVPICMPPDRADFTGRMATVTGWGRLKYGGGVPSVLQEVQVPIIENSVCQEMFNTAGHDKKILNSFLCAGYANGQKDSCEGDSGGPLVLQRPDGRYELAGTVSHGIKCAAPYLPGVYMRTTFYKPWLKAITGIK